MLTPAGGSRGLAWWGLDATYGDRAGGVWTHGGYMHGVRTHMYLYPPASDDVDAVWKGAVILTNGEGDYSDVQHLLQNILSIRRK